MDFPKTFLREVINYSRYNFDIYDVIQKNNVALIKIDDYVNNTRIYTGSALDRAGKGDLLFPAFFSYIVKFLVANSLIHKNKFNKILELGSANNDMRKLLYRTRWKGSYFGVDICYNLLKKNFQFSTNSPTIFISFDLNKGLKYFKNESFDSIINFELIEHLKNKKNAIFLLRECYRVLKNDGIMFLSTPNGRDCITWPKFHKFEFEYNEMLSILKSIGFDIENSFGCLIQRTKNKLNNKLMQEYKDMYKKFGAYLTQVLLAINNPEASVLTTFICRRTKI